MSETRTSSRTADLPDMVVSVVSSMEHNHTGTWRYLRPRYENKVPPCSNGCPAGNDVEGFLTLIGEGKYAEAWARLKEENPLTRVCGRVCFHPCEAACSRRKLDLPVAINALERFVGEHADQSCYRPSLRAATGKTVAVVGSGPAGLTAAYYLARLGHRVTVFEKMPKPGGILRYGIPEHRLPRDVLDDEIGDVVALGVEIRCGTAVGEGGDLSHDDLGRFDAVFLGVGAHRSRALGVEGEDSARVLSGLELLRAAAGGERPDVGERAAVIGGGNTAVDAARVLVRLGVAAEIYYRRSRAEMPAFEEEIEEAVREGVGLNLLVAPVRIERDGSGGVAGVVLRKMRLGDPDESGRRRPEPIEGSDHVVTADTVVAAIGEVVDGRSVPVGVDAEQDGSVVVDGLGRTSRAGLFAGGDVAPIVRTVVTAIGSGKAAAVAIDRYLSGAPLEEAKDLLRVGRHGAVSMRHYLGTGDAHGSYDDAEHVVESSELNMAHFSKAERSRRPKVPVAARVSSFVEVTGGFERAQADAEAARCFHCGVCNECDNCYVFCPDVAIAPRKESGYYDLRYDFCKGCGICVEECPRGAMSITEE